MSPDADRLERRRLKKQASDAAYRARTREKTLVANMTPEQIAHKYALHRASRARVYARDPEGTKAKWRAEYFKRHGMVDQSAEAVLAKLDTAIPRTLPRDVRDDVRNSLMLAILEGQVQARDVVKAVKAYITKHYREYDQHKVLSLDAPVPGMDKGSYGDRLASDVEHV